MRRREFITLLSSAAAWPLAACAQQLAKVPTIGFLGAATPSAWREWIAAFVQRLRELGWIEGRNIAIEYRWAEWREERYAAIADEFVRLKVIRFLDNRPPLLDLGTVQGCKRFWRLPVTRINLLPDIGDSRMYCGVGQGVDERPH